MTKHKKPIQIVCTCSTDGRKGCYVPHEFLDRVKARGGQMKHAKKKQKRHVYNQNGDCTECGLLAVQGDGSYCPAKAPSTQAGHDREALVGVLVDALELANKTLSDFAKKGGRMTTDDWSKTQGAIFNALALARKGA